MEQHKISYKNASGEGGLVTLLLTAIRKIPDLDETTFFYKALPIETMMVSGEYVMVTKCQPGPSGDGIKQSKNHLTIMLCVNMAGQCCILTTQSVPTTKLIFLPPNTKCLPAFRSSNHKKSPSSLCTGDVETLGINICSKLI